VLLQACIATVSLGSAYRYTGTRIANYGVIKHGHAIAASITTFSWWIVNSPRLELTAASMAATNNLLFESVGTDITALLLVDVIDAMSLVKTGAAITPAVVDVSTSTQRMARPFTCHSAVVSCFWSVTASYCCCGKDSNALLCTYGPPKTTTVCLDSKCASEDDALWLWTARTVSRGACQFHDCATQQITSASAETCTKWLPRLSYASACVPVSSQCWCFMADPVCH
jgi:hypothetical protein